MATAKKTEWLVIIPDKEGVHEKRLEVRPKHFEGIKSFEESGKFKMGGAVLNEVPKDNNPQNFSFYGSTIIVVADTKEEVLDIIKKDVYTESGVWDFEKIQIWPVLLAFRNP
ncbi:hypothetical protein SAPIO_CDS10784 [Scedosporium apiospermum]|uniref:YCII-related domain-containing protein n=1 Tax=Pseudallescheria apiosperma TaxID=563466 RepID=A0A084FUJ1_PSEDA|nr:uncharacterized protein SAPIO_CDS10784 [Scedosporium apiospermum]KEZ38753.1 hypothetical protein SAPIO_CDS10784 [Scedosporium apiospermum]